jgi:hypothetical protein
MPETMLDKQTNDWEEPLTLVELEHRIQRLEDVVATICDTQSMEERLRLRVVEQLRSESPELNGGAAHVLAPGDPAEPGAGLVGAQPGAAAQELPSSYRLAAVRPAGGFLLGDMWADLRTFFRMIRDPYFKMSYAAIFMPLLAVVYVVWSLISEFPRRLPVIGPVLEPLAFFFIAYVVLKILGREQRRYLEASAAWRR